MVANEHQEPPRTGEGKTDDATADTRPSKRQKVDDVSAQPETRRSSRAVKITERAKEAM
jgi:hypothetical protein